MSDSSRGTDRLGRRAKRFLSPSQKYEIWLQLVRQETTIGEAADQWEVDRSTIMRLREVAKQGALAALAESRPGPAPRSRIWSWPRQGGGGTAGRGGQGAGRQAAAGGGERALGLPGRVPPRVDAATKAGLLDLVEQAVAAGWEFRAACRVLELGTVRAWRWLGRRAADELADRRPGGSPPHGLLDWEAAKIVRLFHQWGEVDRSHRKLAHRGSYLERVWVLPSSVRRVLAAEGLRLRPLPRPGRSVCKPFPDWVTSTRLDLDFRHDHFTRAGVAATVVEDLVSRKWLPRDRQRGETSTQVQVVVTEAPEREGCWSASVLATMVWSMPPWTTRPGRSCWPSATTAHR